MSSNLLIDVHIGTYLRNESYVFCFLFETKNLGEII